MELSPIQSSFAFERILLASDFSHASDVAAGYAVALARRFSSGLELVNAIDLSVVASNFEALSGPALDAIRRSSEESLELLAENIPGVKVTRKTLEGFSPAELLLQEAVDSKASLIVLGTSSKRGLTKVILGSTAEAIIRAAPCPVLTVGPHVARPAGSPLPFRNIIYAADSSREAALASRYAFEIAHESGARLYLCHVISGKEANGSAEIEASWVASLQKLMPESSFDGCKRECIVDRGKASEVILGLARRVNADLIVLGARRASFWLTYVQTGLTPALLAEAVCPVLTVTS